MARIETYQPDYVITPNDFVIGTDGDNFNKTKNYSVIAMLDYVGTHFNLQSADLVYNFSTAEQSTILDGEFTTNNRLDGTVLFSGVTTFYISKTTVFGRLVDDYIQTLGDDGFSFMLYDFSDYNNFGVYTITSSVDLNSDIKILTVTLVSSSGDIDGTSTYGFKAYPAIGSGGGTFLSLTDTPADYTAGFRAIPRINLTTDALEFTTDYVTLTTQQTVSGIKNFNGANTYNAINTFNQFTPFNAAIAVDGYLAVYNNSYSTGTSFATPALYFENDVPVFLKPLGGGGGSLNRLILDYDNASPRTATFPDKTGTVAYLDDLDISENKLFDQDVDVTPLTGTQTRTSMATITIPADTLDTIGDTLRLKIVGTGDGDTGDAFLYIISSDSTIDESLFNVSNTSSRFVVQFELRVKTATVLHYNFSTVYGITTVLNSGSFTDTNIGTALEFDLETTLSVVGGSMAIESYTVEVLKV